MDRKKILVVIVLAWLAFLATTGHRPFSSSRQPEGVALEFVEPSTGVVQRVIIGVAESDEAFQRFKADMDAFKAKGGGQMTLPEAREVLRRANAASTR